MTSCLRGKAWDIEAMQLNLRGVVMTFVGRYLVRPSTICPTGDRSPYHSRIRCE
jgi:hypothetical protein